MKVLVAAFPERFARLVISNTYLPAGESIGPAFDAWRTFSQATPDFKTGRIVDGGCVRELSSSEVPAYDAPYPDEEYQAHPSAEQAKAFLCGAENGPMCMVNLLKFTEVLHNRARPAAKG